MVIDDEEEGDSEGDILAIEVEEGEEIDGECSVMNLGNLTGEERGSPRTVKLRGSVKGVPILILVDSGATHNFISKLLVATMGWQIEETKTMRIKLWRWI